MTSKLSDTEIAALLREMGQDIGPVNASTRGVYQRKLERLLLEQSSLLSGAAPESPSKELQQTEALKKVVTQNPEVTTDAATETEGDFELDEIDDGSLRLEDDELEEGLTDEKLIGGHEWDRNEFVVEGVRSTNDVRSAGERKFQKDSNDIRAVGKNPFEPVLYDDEGSRKESVSSRRKTYGSFSPAPLATPSARKVKGDAEISHLRQRSVPLGQEITNDVGSYERGPLKPEDYIPLPRSPLSTYLNRCTPPPSSAPQSIDPAEDPSQPARVQPRRHKEHNLSFWIIIAAVILISFLFLLVLYNMEPGYTSPV